MADYAAQQKEFDWLVRPSVMTKALRELRVGRDAGLAVDVGCGTSSGMAAALREDLGAREVLCLDTDAAAVEFLRREGVQAFECDVADAGAVVAPGTVGLVVDKSALDCLLCSDGVRGYLGGVRAMLKADGYYAVASFRTEADLCGLFGGAWRWMHCVEIAPRCRLVILTKGPGADVLAPRAVTPGALPRQRFPLPVPDAYEAMFAEDERAYYALGDFRGDVAAAFPGATMLSAADAASFLKRMG